MVRRKFRVFNLSVRHKAKSSAKMLRSSKMLTAKIRVFFAAHPVIFIAEDIDIVAQAHKIDSASSISQLVMESPGPHNDGENEKHRKDDDGGQGKPKRIPPV